MKWTREEEDDGHVEFEIPVYRLRVQRQLFGWRCRFGRFFVYGVTEAAGNENGGVEEKPYYFTFLKKQTLSYLNYHKNLVRQVGRMGIIMTSTLNMRQVQKIT